MLIPCKCIYNFSCSMLGFISFLVFCPHFRVFLYTFLDKPINKMPQCHLPVFLLFLVPGKSENEYSRNWTGQKPKCLFFRKSSDARVQDKEGQGATTPPGHAAQPGPRQGVVRPALAPPRPLLPPISCPRDENPKYPIKNRRKSLQPPSSPSLDREGSEALPGTLPERGIHPGGLLHHHASLWCDA